MWGTLSDRYGRKYIIIFGVVGAALGLLIFGLSKSYWQAILGRVLSGALSGNLGVLKSFLAEITDDTNRGEGFSYMSLAFAIGKNYKLLLI
jgi:MFS family permease